MPVSYAGRRGRDPIMPPNYKPNYKKICAVLAVCSALMVALFTFGSAPRGNAFGLVPGIDGNFYRTVAGGRGAIPDLGLPIMMPEGALTTLYTFCASGNCVDGAFSRQR